MIRVIIADDHAVLRDGLSFLLSDARDIQIVSPASNGQEAMEQATLRCSDVVLMDYSMPVLNGIEATQKILLVCTNTKVVILSMYHTSEYVQRAIQAGAQGYVLKDSAGAEVVAAIHALFEGKQYFSKNIAGLYT